MVPSSEAALRVSDALGASSGGAVYCGEKWCIFFLHRRRQQVVSNRNFCSASALRLLRFICALQCLSCTSEALAQPATGGASAPAVAYGLRRRYSVSCRDYQRQDTFVVLIGEHPDAFNVVLYLLRALHIGRVNSRSHRATQAVERDVGGPHRFPTRRVDNGQSSNLECPFGVEGGFTQRCGGGPKLPYELAARKYVPANVLDHSGLGRPRFELAQHELVRRGDDVADSLALRSAVSVEGASPFTNPGQPVRHRSTKNAPADVRQSS
jgi:hypothetical protein